MTMKNVAIVLAIVFAATNAKPYSKFGRSCKDIGCLSNEVCVMAEQSCDYGQQRDQCGRYPTCQRSTSGGESCTTKICPSGQYCRTENGRPTCVNTNAGLEDEKNTRQDEAQNNDPKPSAPVLDNSGYPNPSQTTSTPRPASYPGYPSSSNSGYPGYPSSSNSGYPGYPSSSNSGYPNYPSSSNSGYPSYPGQSNSPNTDRYGYPMQSQPSHSNYPSSGNSGYPSGNNGYPGYPTQDSSRRTTAMMNNAGYPSQGGYPNGGGYPGQGGYPAPNPYNNNPYGGYRPQQQSGPYQGGYYPQQQNPNQGYDPYGPPTTKKPSFADKIANYAKNVAKQVITQAIIDKVSGRN